MPTNSQEPNRLELIKAGKIPDARRRPRPQTPAPDTHVQTEIPAVEKTGFTISPEMIAIALMVLLLLALAVFGM